MYGLIKPNTESRKAHQVLASCVSKTFMHQQSEPLGGKSRPTFDPEICADGVCPKMLTAITE
jgi:hypothetical protein